MCVCACVRVGGGAFKIGIHSEIGSSLKQLMLWLLYYNNLNILPYCNLLSHKSETRV
jgi:hypothetical protein